MSLSTNLLLGFSTAVFNPTDGELIQVTDKLVDWPDNSPLIIRSAQS
jgi:hypothetical protein